MTTYTYTGRARRLVLAGRTLVRGVPTDLEGRPAGAAAAHPDVVEGDQPAADPVPDQGDGGAGLAALIEWVEANDEVDPAELATRLRALDADTLAAMAGEYQVSAANADDAIAKLVEALLEDDEPDRRAEIVTALGALSDKDLAKQASGRKLETGGSRDELIARIADAVLAEKAAAAGQDGGS